MVDTSGNLVASYDYNPFGKITASGTYASTNKFRFSSEYHDDETELVYYNYRYYDPELGRWWNRDPIAEKGGYNLYGMVNNNAISFWDYLGYLGDMQDPSNPDSPFSPSNPNNFPKPNVDELLKGLKHWGQEQLDQLTKALKKLCPQKCCSNLAGKVVRKKECEQAASRLAYSIVKAVNQMLKDHINKYAELPAGGWIQNISARLHGPGIQCSDWAPKIYTGAIEYKNGWGGIFDVNQYQSFRDVFRTNDTKVDIGWQREHNWIEIYGPCNKTIRGHGDIIIDPWPDGGKTIMKSSTKWDIVKQTNGTRTVPEYQGI